MTWKFPEKQETKTYFYRVSINNNIMPNTLYNWFRLQVVVSCISFLILNRSGVFPKRSFLIQNTQNNNNKVKIDHQFAMGGWIYLFLVGKSSTKLTLNPLWNVANLAGKNNNKICLNRPSRPVNSFVYIQGGPVSCQLIEHVFSVRSSFVSRKNVSASGGQKNLS